MKITLNKRALLLPIYFYIVEIFFTSSIEKKTQTKRKLIKNFQDVSREYDSEEILDLLPRYIRWIRLRRTWMVSDCTGAATVRQWPPRLALPAVPPEVWVFPRRRARTRPAIRPTAPRPAPVSRPSTTSTLGPVPTIFRVAAVVVLPPPTIITTTTRLGRRGRRATQGTCLRPVVSHQEMEESKIGGSHPRARRTWPETTVNRKYEPVRRTR